MVNREEATKKYREVEGLFEQMNFLTLCAATDCPDQFSSASGQEIDESDAQ